MAKSSLIALALVAFVGACSNFVEQKSAGKIDAGMFVQPDIKEIPENPIEPVVLIKSGRTNCSGTIVSTNSLITAAHCVPGKVTTQTEEFAEVASQVCIRSGPFAGRCADKVFRHARYVDVNKQKENYDVAVVVFLDAPFQDYFPLFSGKPQQGSQIVMVGYSYFKNGQKNLKLENPKRWGRNLIAGFFTNRTMAIDSISSGSENGVSVSPGDSGGPMLQRCSLLGVASQLRINKRKRNKYSTHTNLAAPPIREFLGNVQRDTAAQLCGFAQTNPVFCPVNGRLHSSGTASGEQFPCDQKGQIFVNFRQAAGRSESFFIASFPAGSSEFGYCENGDTDSCHPENSSFKSFTVKPVLRGDRLYLGKVVTDPGKPLTWYANFGGPKLVRTVRFSQ